MLRWSEKSPQNTSMIAVPLSLESVRKTGKACFIILHGDPRCNSRRASASGNIFVNSREVEMSGGFHLETILYHVKLNNCTCIKHWRESGVIFAQKNETHDLKHSCWNTRTRVDARSLSRVDCLSRDSRDHAVGCYFHLKNGTSDSLL